MNVTLAKGSQSPPKGRRSANDKAADTREGLFDSVKGRAKEVAGALSGKDDLVEEGQLQQAAARNRKAALADEPDRPRVASVRRTQVRLRCCFLGTARPSPEAATFFDGEINDNTDQTHRIA